MQPVDLVIVDAVEDVGKKGLRIKAVQFGGFDDGHGAGESFCACVGPREEPVFPS